jgi:hypothetical protein
MYFESSFGLCYKTEGIPVLHCYHVYVSTPSIARVASFKQNAVLQHLGTSMAQLCNRDLKEAMSLKKGNDILCN